MKTTIAYSAGTFLTLLLTLYVGYSLGVSSRPDPAPQRAVVKLNGRTQAGIQNEHAVVIDLETGKMVGSVDNFDLIFAP